MRTLRRAARITLGFATSLVVMHAQASPVAAVVITTIGNSSSSAYTSFTLGYRFEALAATSVVSLGVWDYQGNGLAQAHAVGLWDSVGSLLASVSVAAGTADLLDSGYRWVDLSSSIRLSAGQAYTVAAYYNSINSDLVADLVDAVTVDSRVDVQGSVQRPGGSLAFATESVHPFNPGDFSYGGGNVRLNNDVPEPATIALAAIGLLSATLARKRRA